MKKITYRDEFLGESFGRASYRLNRKILFSLLQETGRDTCYKCGKKMIEIDFSLDHKKPWLYESKELFWDLNNIAFSHKRCNTVDRPSFRARPPEGKAWCSGCKQYLDEKEFGALKKKTATRTTTRGYCKICRLERKKEGKSY